MLIRRLFGGYDPTLHSIVVKNKRKEKKKKRMRQITEKSHRRGMVWFGDGVGPGSICLELTGLFS